MSIFSALTTNPAGECGLLLAPLWSGERVAGERCLDAVSSFTGATVVARGWSSYAKTFDLEAEKAWPKGKSYYLDARNLPRLDEEAAERLVESAATFPSPGAHLVLHDFHGAPSRVAPDATVFPLRRDHFDTQIIVSWDANLEHDQDRHIKRAQTTSERLSGLALPGGYPNLLGTSDTRRARQFYGDAVTRLSAVKTRVDPTNLFCSNTGQL